MLRVGKRQCGYDNVTRRYWSTWTDNGSTGLLVMHADRDGDRNAMSLEGENTHPLRGQPHTMRSIARDLGHGKPVMNMYEDYGDGMVKAFSVTMTKIEG